MAGGVGVGGGSGGGGWVGEFVRGVLDAQPHELLEA